MSIDQDRANSGAPVAAPTVAVPGAAVAAESSPSPEASPGPSSPASAAAGSGWVEYGPRRRGGNIDRNSVPNSTAALPQYLAAIPAETTRRQMQLVRTIKVEYPHSGKACVNCNCKTSITPDITDCCINSILGERGKRPNSSGSDGQATAVGKLT